MRRRSVSILVAGLILFSGCAKPPQINIPPMPPIPPPPPPPPAPVPRNIELAVFADSRVNPDSANRPAPVVVRVLLLRSPVAFNAADFFALFDKEQATLGNDLIAREEIQLRPGETARLTKPLPADARMIAALVAFRDLERANWRAIKRLPDAPPPTSNPPKEAQVIPVTIIAGERSVRIDAGN